MLRPVVLDPEQSAALRERLLAEIGKTASADLAASWAQEALTAKNSLTAADAKLVEDAFELRISELVASETTQRSNDASSTTKAAGSQEVRKRDSSENAPNRPRACSRFPRRGVIATGSTCAMSLNSLAWCAAASRRTLTTSHSHSRALSVVR
jgi:hypothetical protein